jgi:lantibiotic biosynthesis protein
MDSKIRKLINEIDRTISTRLNRESYGILSGSGGCSLYFAHRFFLVQKNKFLNKSIELLEKIIAISNSELSFNCSHMNTCSSCILIDIYIKHNLLDNKEKENSKTIINVIISSIRQKELEINQHDLFYGFIGKAIIVMEHNQEFTAPFVMQIINALKSNSLKNLGRIHWKTPYPFNSTENYEETINLGIPHGSCGIILFLIKCCEIYQMHEKLQPLLEGNINWLISLLEKENNKVLYSYSSTPSATGKLGWCYGDQAIAYTLLRFYETFNYEPAKVKAYELIEQAASKPMDQTGVQFYPAYGYYDIRVCHGTSSVAYMWLKMYHITKDENMKNLADKWLQITLDNLEIYLPQLDKIAELEKDNDKIDTSMGFLNGLSGVGLVLMAFLDPKLSDWDKLLLLDRPGRE